MASFLQYSARRFLQTSARRAAHIEGPSAVSGGEEGGYKVWRNLTFFVAFPSIALCMAHCYMAHNKKEHERPPFVKYDYMYIRTKRFPWGDGNKSLFHNPHVNALPDGYEEIEEH
ncbi:cytochrome c oxidase subunit 6A1, mitochondrial [Coccinella septempunctata]|uniref:cytochrome c oxidase subunit 6A1, mitochondrial n=1 Tax=Coccinella septempunctata TaxID=41139 RepID=UPI001D07619D|nr:cytochrome c oxidase subunit 6A1, mitochondrial [Coccinella septempunctata]